MVDASVLIGAIIIAITQAVKILSPKVSGIVTMVVAVLVGVLIALLDTNIGLANISVAQGILTALGAIGVHTALSSVNTRAS